MNKDRNKITGGGHKRSHQILSFSQNFGGILNPFNQSEKNTLARFMAFTLAEVLITLAIIGVVAALTIPSVITSYNDKKYNTARLKALKTFGEAGKLASINGEINGQENARSFVENVLSKYLKITKICDNNKASECNFPEYIQQSDLNSRKYGSNSLRAWNDMHGRMETYNNWTDIENKDLSVYVTTNDGFSAKVFYNPNCAHNSHEITFANYWGTCTYKECWIKTVDATCMDVIYDMNGTKGPNHVGEDIGFVTTFWSGLKATSVAPGIIPYDKNIALYNNPYTASEAQAVCANLGTQKVPYSLPNVDELSSISLHWHLTSQPGDDFLTGSSVADRQNILWIVHYCGGRGHGWNSTKYYAWCVRR